ncbi:MAG: DUF975 family protein [Candidatus Nomurabacteria bacterium]|jgi:uncharacterized membrane protein|nr:DUF975 family protein [Candidatus Nomurabacteria bacterium]
MDRKALKTAARQAIEGKIWVLLAIYILVMIVSSALSYVTFGAGAILISGGVSLSFSTIFLAIVIHGKKPKVEDIMIGFKDGNFGRGFVGYIRYTVFVCLWTLLFVIPGIVKSLAYSQMFFIMADDKKIDAGDAQKKSIEMMDGHKGEYFVLGLSFIPWYLLVGITFGLAAIWVGPYVEATFANYYLALKKVKK